MFEKYDAAVRTYLANIKINGLSRKTQENYANALRYFRESMEADGYSEACPAAVLSFKQKKASCGLNTVYQYVGIIENFSKFCEDYEFCESFVRKGSKPDSKIVSKTVEKPYAHILTVEQIHTLIHAETPEHGNKPHTWKREQAEVTLLVTSGARNSELRALTLADLDWDNGLMYLKVTKGNKPRMALFTPEAQKKVRAYLDSPLHPGDLPDTAPLFGTIGRKTGEWHELTDKQLSALVYQYTKSVLGEEYACRTHAQRHGFASIALENDIPIDVISKLLGHSNIKTTQIYAQRLSPEQLCADVGTKLNKVFA